MNELKNKGKGEDTQPGKLRKGVAPNVFANLQGIVPQERTEAFIAFASGKDRLFRILRKDKDNWNESDVNELKAAYKAFEEQETRTALVLAEAPKLALTLGLKEEKVRGYLEVYNPDQLRKLGKVAQEQGSTTEETIEIDLGLINDGSYADRESETVTLSSVQASLNRIVNKELEGHASREAIRSEDENLDNQWEALLKKHKGNEMAAAEEYQKIAEGVLDAAASSAVEEAKPFSFQPDQVVELLKLFNYDREDVHRFLEHVELNFSLGPDDTEEKIPQIVFKEMLGSFAVENAGSLVLNERSKYYRPVRLEQLSAGAIEEGVLIAGNKSDGPELESETD